MIELLRLDFETRLTLALDEVRLTFERRANYLSDDDLLDAADNWTTDAPYGDEDIAIREDYDRLVEALFETVFGS